ncbi:hypothetical protein VCR17J2_570002 [Vibrio coralliirubri]|nr:hypothetical protein VCR17J2_570002 [Vibrio coralliirubri]
MINRRAALFAEQVNQGFIYGFKCRDLMFFRAPLGIKHIGVIQDAVFQTQLCFMFFMKDYVCRMVTLRVGS